MSTRAVWLPMNPAPPVSGCAAPCGNGVLMNEFCWRLANPLWRGLLWRPLEGSLATNNVIAELTRVISQEVRFAQRHNPLTPLVQQMVIAKPSPTVRWTRE